MRKIITKEFSITKEDFINSQSGYRSRFNYIIISLLIIQQLYYVYTSPSTFTFIEIIPVIFIIGLLIIFPRLSRNRIFNTKIGSRILARRTMEFDDDFIYTKYLDGSEVQVPFGNIKKAIIKNGLILFYKSFMVTHIIPETAFESYIDLNEFYRLLITKNKMK